MEPLPSIEILGVTVSEPVTVLTDFILAIFCFIFYKKLKALSKGGSSKRYFANYFLFMAIGTFLGGLLGHGLFTYLGMVGKYPSWIITIITMSLLMLAAMELIPGLNEKQKDKFLMMTIFLAIIFLILTFYNRHFSYVIYHNIVAAIIIIPIFVHLLIKFKMKGTEYLLISFTISASIPYFQINKIGFNKWFTYHDVCHTIMLVGLTILFYGAHVIYKNIEFTQRTTDRFK